MHSQQYTRLYVHLHGICSVISSVVVLMCLLMSCLQIAMSCWRLFDVKLVRIVAHHVLSTAVANPIVCIIIVPYARLSIDSVSYSMFIVST